MSLLGSNSGAFDWGSRIACRKHLPHSILPHSILQGAGASEAVGRQLMEQALTHFFLMSFFFF